MRDRIGKALGATSMKAPRHHNPPQMMLSERGASMAGPSSSSDMECTGTMLVLFLDLSGKLGGHTTRAERQPSFGVRPAHVLRFNPA